MVLARLARFNATLDTAVYAGTNQRVDLKAHSHQIKIVTDWFQTSFRLVLDSKIGVNGTILYQCNPMAFYQSEASLKPVGSQSEASRLQI